MLRSVGSTSQLKVHRKRWIVTGIVQGVGFRPFVYRVAHEIGVSGIVRNTPGGVLVEAQGSAEQLSEFDHQLHHHTPAMAEVRGIHLVELPPIEDEGDFIIDESAHDSAPTAEIAPDSAVCPQCLSEMRDQHDRRRFHYGLNNCTNCGPRFSIIQKVPYDRVNTTMADFSMCVDCRREFDSPINRRFHAQPIACHVCGPKVRMFDSHGQMYEGDAVAHACKRLAAGQTIAIKGIGGFHLACRADDEQAVVQLRELKHRESKPLAIMVRSIAVAKDLVHLTERAAALLTSPRAPIVLCVKKPGTLVAPSVAPHQHRLGLMLPYSPLHHLVFDSLDPRIHALVLTSGNGSEEPLVYDDTEVRERLGPISKAVLTHERPIQRPVDDSVIIETRHGDPIFLRRSRGYVPTPIEIKGVDARARGIALGAELKSTVAVVRGSEVILSQHLGDLSHARSYANFKKVVHDLCDLFGIVPKWIAHDMHPSYLSTTFGAQLAAKLHVPILRIQHHYAHAAGVLAEHGHPGPALALVCDGTGFGPDHTVWGGELLVVDFKQFHRVGHLKTIRLAGGDAAAKQTWRCAMAMLFNALGKDFDQHPMAKKLVPVDKDRAMFVQMLRGNTACVSTSSTGRVFDAVAGLIGACSENTHEAEAAMALESLAARYEGAIHGMGLFNLDKKHEVMQLDLSPFVVELLKLIERGTPAEEIAALFHEQLSEAWEATVLEAVERTGLTSIALSGGCFCNEIFSDRLAGRLDKLGLHVMRHKTVPPNDGGIAFGQAAIGAMRTGKQEVH